LLQRIEPDHYATLGLDTRCTLEQIRAAYRVLAKQFHPDVNQQSPEALSKTQQLNAAYEVLSDAQLRQTYDESRRSAQRRVAPRAASSQRNVTQDTHLRVDEFLRGTTLTVRVNDPGNPDGAEDYELLVPAGTAPGTRFRIPRTGHFEGGIVTVRVGARPDFRFKVKGSDLRCDLRISTQRAAQGGSEMVKGITGMVRINIPRKVERGEIIRVAGEGLPKANGDRGDLLVRIMYRPEVRISRTARR
jgi:DnaJ-class molecular chaperone